MLISSLYIYSLLAIFNGLINLWPFVLIPSHMLLVNLFFPSTSPYVLVKCLLLFFVVSAFCIVCFCVSLGNVSLICYLWNVPPKIDTNHGDSSGNSYFTIITRLDLQTLLCVLYQFSVMKLPICHVFSSYSN